jgi:hypothetical protein
MTFLENKRKRCLEAFFCVHLHMQCKCRPLTVKTYYMKNQLSIILYDDYLQHLNVTSLM